jgi:hypothetical protein
MSAALVLAMAAVAPRPASAQVVRYEYRGLYPLYANLRITMDLHLTSTPGGGFDVTGSIYDRYLFSGSHGFTVKGTFSGGMMAAGATATGGVFLTPVTGALVGGGLGTGMLDITGGVVPMYNTPIDLTLFALAPVGSPVSTPTPTPTPTPAPSPSMLDFHATAGFGYTRVDLFMRFQLIGLQSSGGVYQVSGVVTVHALRPPSDTVLQVSGTYLPSAVPAPFTVTGAPAGSNPLLTATRIGAGTLDCQLTGIPSLGITSLYLTGQTMPQHEIVNTTNSGGVANGGISPTISLQVGEMYSVQRLYTYHWNDGNGATPGSIGLEDRFGNVTWWAATASPGQGGAPNVNWDVSAPAGPNGAPFILEWDKAPYTILDSSPGTWSQDQGVGFAIVWVD